MLQEIEAKQNETIRAIDIIDKYLSKGHELEEIKSFLEDGEALASEGIDDQNLVDLAYDIVVIRMWSRFIK